MVSAVLQRTPTEARPAAVEVVAVESSGGEEGAP